MKQIPMLDLRAEYEYMKKEIDFALAECMVHQKWIFGPEVTELERNISHYVDVEHGIGTSSGTEALVLSLRALAIRNKGEEFFGKDDLIITSPFTFTATGDAILRSGATPLFVDIDPVTYNIDPEKIHSALSSRPLASRVVGILPVHLYGQSCDMDEILSVAEKYNLFIVEDVAQAFGCTWKDRKLGSLGTLGAFSFFPSKNLGGFGDGGMISTDDEELSIIIRMLIKHGGKDKYNVDHIGYNARLDTIQAAVLLAKLKYIDEFNNQRRKIGERYTNGLSGIDGLSLPITHHPSPIANRCHVYHQYTIRTSNRDELQAYLREKGISTMIYYPVPLHHMKVFEGRIRIFGSLEHAEQACGTVLSLPIEPLQNNEDTSYIIASIKEFFDKSK